MLINCTVAAQLNCAFVFAYAKCRFFHDVAHFSFISIKASNLSFRTSSFIAGQSYEIKLKRLGDLSEFQGKFLRVRCYCLSVFVSPVLKKAFLPLVCH